MGSIRLIEWEKVLLIIDQMALLRVYATIVASMDDNYTWYSNLESRSRIEWRWQIAPSTVKYAISKLVKKGLLLTDSRGVYTIDKKFITQQKTQHDTV